MKKYIVYLLEYLKGEERLNRIYASPFDIFYIRKDGFFGQIEDFAQTIRRKTLEDIAVAVEKEFLEEQGFIILGGLKLILPSYKEIVREIHPIKISEPSE